MPVHVTFNMSWKLSFEEILEKEYIIAPSPLFLYGWPWITQGLITFLENNLPISD